MKRRVILLLPLALWAEEDGLQHSLTKYVTDDGKVRYGALKADLGPLEKYVEKLKSLEEGRMGLADWINAYNALILWSFAKEYPQEKDRLKNPLRRASYFYRRKFVVAGRERSLADIENNSIRKAFREPRIHFAIVCKRQLSLPLKARLSGSGSKGAVGARCGAVHRSRPECAGKCGRKNGDCERNFQVVS